MTEKTKFDYYLKSITKEKRESLELLYDHFLKDFVVSNKLLFRKVNVNLAFLEKKKPTKPQLFEIYTSLFCYPEILAVFLTSVPVYLKEIFEKVVWEGPQSLEKLENRYQIKSFSKI